MKQNFILSCVACIGILFCTDVHAQSIKYTYDASGNRISRNVITMSSRLKSSGASSNNKVAVTELPKFEEALGDMIITIYPNPTKGMLQVDISGGDISKDARIYLYNFSGMMVRQLSGVSVTNFLDISAQPTGVYTMKIVLDKNNVSTWKIIKE